MTVNEYRKRLIDKYQFDTTHYNETLVNDYIERKKKDRKNKIKSIYE